MRGLQRGTGRAIKGGVLLLGALTLVACASTAQTTAQASATAEAAPEDVSAMDYLTKKVNRSGVVRTVKIDGVEKLCKRQKQIGSNLKKTICLTEEEWAKLEADSREATKKFQRTVDIATRN
ncbi:MAG: hypothetical protein AAFP97_09785 [Pseudomonadota bacterium]